MTRLEVRKSALGGNPPCDAVLGWDLKTEGNGMRNVIYIIGLIVVVIAVLSLAGIV